MMVMNTDSIESKSNRLARPLTLRRSVLWGGMGFLAASVVVYGSWALAGRWMYATLSEIGAYGAWAVMFILISGTALRPLIAGANALRRSYVVFTVSFFSYAAVWTAAWFLLRDLAGEWLASLAGTGAMAVVLAALFRNIPSAGRIWVVLFLGHSAGYFAGRYLYGAVAGPPGMILWGVAYGIGFGAAIGYAYFKAQERETASPPVERGEAVQ